MRLIFFDLALSVMSQRHFFLPQMWITGAVVVQDMHRPLRVQWERAYANYNLCLDGKSGDGPEKAESFMGLHGFMGFSKLDSP